MATRSLFVALATVAALAAAPGAASAQTNPGAMKANGNFFTFTQCRLSVINSAEWDEANQKWVLGPAFPRPPVSAPAGPTLSGGFVATVRDHTGKESLERWDPLSPGTTTNLGSPTSGCLMSDPTVRGPYAYVVAEPSCGYAAGNMYRCTVATGTWTDLGVPVGTMLSAEIGGLGEPYYSAPCVGITYQPPRRPLDYGWFVRPGPSLFAIDHFWDDGMNSVYEKNLGVPYGPSAWIDRGNPGWLGGGGGDAMTVSAPMPGKIFATSTDGGLYQLYKPLDSGSVWANHGTPAPGYVIGANPAVATQDGEAYVVAWDPSAGLREVFQLRWSSGTWTWTNLGSPYRVSIDQYAWPVAAYSGLGLAQRIVVVSSDGNYWMLWQDTGGAWQWKNLGRPPYGPCCGC